MRQWSAWCLYFLSSIFFHVSKILADKIEEVVANDKHGYTSVPDFVKEAVRRYLRDLGYLE